MVILRLILSHEIRIFGESMPKHKTFTDEIRDAIKSCGMTRYRICKEIGLAESGMSKFMAGTSGFSMEMLDKIAAVIGMHVILEQNKGR